MTDKIFPVTGPLWRPWLPTASPHYSRWRC